MHASAPPSKSSPRPSGTQAFAAILFGNVSLALGPWMVRLADVGPVAAGFWRLLLALPVLVALALWSRRRGTARAAPAALWGVLALAGLFFAADLAAWHAGIRHTRMANATLFGNVTSFLFPLYGFVVARSWPGRWQGAALLLAACGVALLMGRSYELSPRNLQGDLLCIAAGVFYTVYLIALGRVDGRIAPLSALTAATAAGVLPLLGAAWLLDEAIRPRDWTPLVLLAIGSQLVGQGLIVYAIGRLKPVVVGLSLLVQPIVAATIGWIVYGERLGPVDFAGAALIAAALVLVRRPERGAAPPAPTS